jgi:hypothetical protein
MKNGNIGPARSKGFSDPCPFLRKRKIFETTEPVSKVG